MMTKDHKNGKEGDLVARLSSKILSTAASGTLNLPSGNKGKNILIILQPMPGLEAAALS
jgi:hypothetical protein